MPKIQLCATLSDLDAALVGSPPLPVPLLDTHGNVILLTRVTDWALGRKLDTPGTQRLHARFAERFTQAVLAAFDGPTYAKPNKLYMLTTYRDGGTKPVNYMLIKKVQVNFGGPQKGIILEGNDISEGLLSTLIDRATYDIQTLANVVAGVDLTVQTGGKDARGVRVAHSYVNNLRALQDSIPGRDNQPGTAFFQFTFAPDPAIATTTIDTDVNSDNVLATLKGALRAAAGLYNRTDTAPLGARGHFSIDVVNRMIRCGHIGTDPVVTLTNQRAFDAALDQSLYSVVGTENITFAVSKEKEIGQTQVRGSTTNHGIPDNGRFTGLALAKLPLGGGLANSWADGAALVGVATGDEGGGIFLYIHDNKFYRVSGTFDVYDLYADHGTSTYYAATSYGVKTYQGGVPTPYGTPPTWTTVGGLTAPVDKIWFYGERLYALCTQSGSGGNGLFMTPQDAGEGDTTAVGYAGWTRIASGGNIKDAGGDYFSALYLIDGGKTDTLYVRLPDGTMKLVHPGAGIVGTPVGIDVPNSTVNGNTVIRFSDGSQAYPDPARPDGLKNLDSGNNLSDSFGRLIATQISWADTTFINGYGYSHYALTDRGLFGALAGATPLPGVAPAYGGSWVKISAAAGMDDLQATKLVVSTPQTVLTHSIQRLYAISDKSFWVSNSGGIWWFDVMAQPLDLGAFWGKLARECGAGDYPSNDVGALGNLSGAAAQTGPRSTVQSGGARSSAALTDTGGAGSVLPIPLGNPRVLPADWVWARRLTEHFDFTYRLVRVNNTAPFNAIQTGDLPTATADDTRGDIAAGEQLALAAFYFQSATAEVSTMLVLPCLASDAYAAVLSVLPQDRVALDISFTTGLDRVHEGDEGESYAVCDFTPDQLWYCVQYDEAQSGSILQPTLTVCNLAALADFTFAEYMDAVANGQRADRRYARHK